MQKNIHALSKLKAENSNLTAKWFKVGLEIYQINYSAQLVFTAFTLESITCIKKEGRQIWKKVIILILMLCARKTGKLITSNCKSKKYLNPKGIFPMYILFFLEINKQQDSKSNLFIIIYNHSRFFHFLMTRCCTTELLRDRVWRGTTRCTLVKFTAPLRV